MKKLFRLVLLLLLFYIAGRAVLMLMTGLFFLSAINAEHPSDAEMIDYYFEHQISFERLADMLIHEQTFQMIYPAGGAYLNGKCQSEEPQSVRVDDDERCAEYVRLFNELGFEEAGAGSEPFHLPVSSSGILDSGTQKGYFYSSTPPNPVVLDTDEWNGESHKMYRHMEGHWYIYYAR